MMNGLLSGSINRRVRRGGLPPQAPFVGMLETLESRRLLSTTFAGSDLTGTWAEQGMHEYGSVQFSGTDITGGQFTKEDGSPETPSGTVSFTAAGNFSVNDGSGSGPSGSMNLSKNVVAYSTLGKENRLSFLVKTGASDFMSADAQGTWAIFLNGGKDPGGSVSQNSGHGTLTLDGSNNFTGTLTFDSDGTTQPPSGTYSLSPSGSVNVNVSGAKMLQGYMSLSKDVIVENPTDFTTSATNNDSRLIVLLKQSGSYSNASMQGAWNLIMDKGQGVMLLDGVGGIKGVLTSNDGKGSITGTYSVNADGTFTVHVTTVDSSGTHSDDFQGALNASHDVAVFDKVAPAGQEGDDDMVIMINSGQNLTVLPPTPPGITSVTPDNPSPSRLTRLTLSAGGVSTDAKQVIYYADLNDDGIIDAGDKKLGTSASKLHNFQVKVPITPKTPLGDIQVLAVAKNRAGSSAVVATTVTITDNTKPKVASLSALPKLVTAGSSFVLRANGVSDRDGNPGAFTVNFYQGATLIGSSNKAAGWKFTVPASVTTGLVSGDTLTFTVQAVDDANNLSDITNKDSVTITIK